MHHPTHTRPPRRRTAGRRILPLMLLLSLLFSLALLPAAARPSSAQQATGQAIVDDRAEILYQPDYLHLATGDPLGEHSTYAWPFAFESLGHLIQSYQNYGSPYFHGGLDIMADSGTMVYERTGGQVVNIENYQYGNDLYWEVAILDLEGYLWQFHHIDHYTIPQYIWDKYDEYLADPVHGGFVPPDTHIGNIVWWPVGYSCTPDLFHHIHLNILGAGGEWLNGLEFMTPLADTSAPEVLEIGLLKNGQIYPGNQVSGDYSLYVHTRDLILAPDCYWLPPHEVAFSVDGGPTTTTWRFDNLPGGDDRNIYSEDLFVVPPTCGDYGCNEFFVDAGFVPSGQRTFPAEPGAHTVTITVTDYAGNVDTGSFTYSVQGSGPTLHAGDLDGLGRLHPNGQWRADVSVLVHTSTHTRLAGAVVTGTWSSGGPGTTTCTTGINGRCTLARARIPAGLSSVTFTVSSVVKTGYTYMPASNHDPDGDSNGTAITVHKP